MFGLAATHARIKVKPDLSDCIPHHIESTFQYSTRPAQQRHCRAARAITLRNNERRGQKSLPLKAHSSIGQLMISRRLTVIHQVDQSILIGALSNMTQGRDRTAAFGPGCIEQSVGKRVDAG